MCMYICVYMCVNIYVCIYPHSGFRLICPYKHFIQSFIICLFLWYMQQLFQCLGFLNYKGI